MDLHAFYIGQSFDAWKYFGAHPVKEKNLTGYRFRVYAPNALELALIGTFSDWKPLPMAPLGDGGIYELFVPGAEPGMMYKFAITAQDGTVTDHADPYAFASELRPGTASVTADLSNTYTDEDWMQARSIGYNDPINIYEMHFGSWRRRPDGSWYSYAELAEALIDYLQEHDYTHVEFMPLSEYPADESWGYQVSGFYSLTSRYGTPEEFMALVNGLHNAGIGVIMDFVPVHFALDAYALSMFDGSALYEYPSTDTGYSEWGSRNFNYYRGEVRSFLQSAADFWCSVYHVDGLRMDAISNAIYWQGNKERGENEGAVEFIRGLNKGLAQRWPTVMKIAEDSTNYLKVTAPVQYDGLGFDYKWDMGWMNDTLDFFTYPPEDRSEHMGKLKWSMQYFYNELYVLPLSHDEVVHGKHSILDKMPGEYENKFAQARLLYLYMYTHPGKKLNFMGYELGHFSEWSEARQLDWMLLDFPAHQELNSYLTALNTFYKLTPALWQEDYNRSDFTWIETDHPDTMAFVRSDAQNKVLVVLNFGAQCCKDILIEYPGPAEITEVFATHDHMFAAQEKLETVMAPGLNRRYKGRMITSKPSWQFKMSIMPFGGYVYTIEDKPMPKAVSPVLVRAGKK